MCKNMCTNRTYVDNPPKKSPNLQKTLFSKMPCFIGFAENGVILLVGEHQSKHLLSPNTLIDVTFFTLF